MSAVVRLQRLLNLMRNHEPSRFWSRFWRPTRFAAEGYFRRHGMGYTTIGSSFGDVGAQRRTGIRQEYCTGTQKRSLD